MTHVYIHFHFTGSQSTHWVHSDGQGNLFLMADTPLLAEAFKAEDATKICKQVRKRIHKSIECVPCIIKADNDLIPDHMRKVLKI